MYEFINTIHNSAIKYQEWQRVFKCSLILSATSNWIAGFASHTIENSTWEKFITKKFRVFMKSFVSYHMPILFYSESVKYKHSLSKLHFNIILPLELVLCNFLCTWYEPLSISNALPSLKHVQCIHYITGTLLHLIVLKWSLLESFHVKLM